MPGIEVETVKLPIGVRDEGGNRPGQERADANDAGATGVGSQDQAPSNDSEAALRRADENGEPAAATELGLLLERRGDLAGAESAYRRSDRRGDARGAFNLGRLLAARGDLPAAAVAYRRAEKGGEPAGATSLGTLLEQLGDPVGAAAAYGRAGDRGHAAGAVHLGRLLASNGEVIGAEAAYRRASELGDADGALQLAKLRAERGEPASARPAGQSASSDEHDVAAGAVESPAPPSGEATAEDRKKRGGGTAPRRRDRKRGHSSARWYLRRRFGAGATTSAASTAPGVSSPQPEDRRSTTPEHPATGPQAPGSDPAALEPESAVPEPVVVDPEPVDPEPVAVEPEPALPAVDSARAHRVMALQRQLVALGFDLGPIDGRFGPRTTDAVRYLQEMCGLEPDGVVGPLTAEVLRHSAPEAPSDDRAKRVQTLQRQLGWLGFEPGRADGQYGPLTTGAVKRFQEANDLPADGIVDRATADALRASISQRPSSDRIDRVKSLQRQLHWLGFEPGAIDGRYGPQTTEAVRRFQAAHDLPVDGIVEHATQRALQESVHRTGEW